MSDKFWTDEVAEFTYPLPKAPAGDPLYGAALRGGGVSDGWYTMGGPVPWWCEYDVRMAMVFYFADKGAAK